MSVEQALRDAIEPARETRQPIQIELKALTPFSWDRAFVFGPYTTSDRIESTLGIRWPAAADFDLARRDDICLIVFMSGSSVVSAVAFPRQYGDFTRAATPRGLAPQEARFQVSHDPEQDDWLIVSLIGPAE
jgi:hypothetical protein